MTEEEKEKAIKATIQALCNEQALDSDRIQYFLDQFQKIYKGGYRHKYAKISAAIMEYLQGNTSLELVVKTQDTLLQNLRNLIEKARAGKKEFLGKLEELYEHCNLKLQQLVATSKEKELKAIIQALCNEQALDSDRIQYFLDQFQKIYKGGYRHRYAKISAAIMEYLQGNTSLELVETQDTLLQNLRSLIEKARAEKKEFLRKLEEFYEHCNLELQQLAIIYQLRLQAQESQKQAEKSQKQAESFQKQTQESQEQIEQLRKELEKSQTQYVTILGIFAAMIAAFVSVMTISNGVLTALSHASPYRLIFIACFMGLVFANLLTGLFYFLAKITHKDSQCFLLDSFKNPIVFLNLLLIAIMLFTIIEYACGTLFMLLGMGVMGIFAYKYRECFKKILSQ